MKKPPEPTVMRLILATLALLIASSAQAQQLTPDQQLARDVYRELIEINSSTMTSGTTIADTMLGVLPSGVVAPNVNGVLINGGSSGLYPNVTPFISNAPLSFGNMEPADGLGEAAPGAEGPGPRHRPRRIASPPAIGP